MDLPAKALAPVLLCPTPVAGRPSQLAALLCTLAAAPDVQPKQRQCRCAQPDGSEGLQQRHGVLSTHSTQEETIRA